MQGTSIGHPRNSSDPAKTCRSLDGRYWCERSLLLVLRAVLAAPAHTCPRDEPSNEACEVGIMWWGLSAGDFFCGITSRDQDMRSSSLLDDDSRAFPLFLFLFSVWLCAGAGRDCRGCY